ncbi:hypothetical protein [Lentzea flaviverrucosa]|uniref:hypothetical protein n=1 Tax=Lentzea flaviverrucosa TaxID=200379 RepID=UPI000B7EE21C|nr:hypothetical protein [Lentzea flaviverrucosa]
MGISRRAVLLGGAGMVGAAGTYGALTPRGRRLLGWTGPDGVVPSVEPVPVQPMPWGAWMGAAGPVVLVLHGRGGSVAWWEELGLPRFLQGCGFRCAVVNGGEDYWVGFDPLAPFEAALGVSMGGFGVLDIASRHLRYRKRTNRCGTRQPRRHRSVCGVAGRLSVRSNTTSVIGGACCRTR